MKAALPLLLLTISTNLWSQPGRLDQMSVEQKVAAGAGFHQHRAEPIDGFLVLGNIYYVGASDLASYLITTDEGHFLVDTGVSEMTSVIRENIENLGFRLQDVRYLLQSHAHFDHIQGHAVMQRLTGAQVLVMDDDADAMVAGRDLSPLGFEGWEPVAVDRRLSHGESVSLGSTTMVATKAPGHTPGCTTWTLETEDSGERVNVAIFGCNGPNNGVQLVGNPRFPSLVEDSRQGFDNLQSLSPDLYLQGHIEQAFDGLEHLMRVQARPHPLLTQQPWQSFIAQRRAEFEARVESELAANRSN